ncbi:hypothetical protein PSPO01_15550 [Paraphaeosphaeria sporulosa]
MANLAGFDVVAEVHIDTITDLINQFPVTNPVDGRQIHLLGGKFSTDLLLPINTGINRPILRVFLDITLHPVVHESQAEVRVAISAGSTVFRGRSLNNLGGDATVVVPIIFELPPGAPASTPQTPNVVFSGTRPRVTWNQQTQRQIDGTLGQGTAATLATALQDALAELLARAGRIPVRAAGFLVRPGVVSHRPNQLSALPTLAWITVTAFGVFGYYRASAGGGDIRRKTTDDLQYQPEDYLTSGPERFPIPACRVAILLSDVGFQHVIACAITREVVIKGILSFRERPRFATDDDLNKWLNSEAGQAALDANLTIPCGTHATLIKAIATDFTQSDIAIMLESFEMVLEEGRVTVKFKAGGNAEQLTGDTEFHVTGDASISFQVVGGTVTPLVQISRLVPNVEGGIPGFLFNLLEDLFQGLIDSIWVVIRGLAIQRLTQVVSETINTAIQSIPQSLPPPLNTLSTRIEAIEIHPSSVRLIGLVGRVFSLNTFEPGVSVDATPGDRTAGAPSINGVLNVPKTDWGCEAAQFNYTRTFWDETFSIRLRTRDLLLPITVLSWSMEMGNFSFLTPFGPIDPRISWSGDGVPVTPGSHSVAGKVEHLTEVHPPSMEGPLSDGVATVSASGDPTNWQIRLFGSDGNFHLRFIAVVQDGNEKVWTSETYITHHGDQLEMSADYETYQKNCEEKLTDWFGQRASGLHLGELVVVHPGDAVMNAETRESIAIRDSLSSRDASVFFRAQEGVAKFGPKFLTQLGKARLSSGI